MKVFTQPTNLNIACEPRSLALNQVQPHSAINDGVFKVPLPIRPTTQIKNLCNIYKQKQLAILQEKKSQYENFIKLLAIKNAIMMHQKKMMVEAMKKNKEDIKKRNTKLFLQRMKYYSQLPQFSNCIFRIPAAVNGWDVQDFTIQQIDKFIFENELIAFKKVVDEEKMEPQENSNENSQFSSTDESDNGSSHDNEARDRKVREVIFRVPSEYLNDSEFEFNCDSDQSKQSENINSEERQIGKLSISQRSQRILKYKEQIVARRLRCPISKKFNGRSKVACNKLRVNGKFVKASAQ